MDFVAANCPKCGGNLQLDPEKELGFCMHCGTKIVIQEAIRAVRVDNSHLIDTWMEMADMAAKSGNNQEAYAYYTRVLESQPNNWKAYFGKGKAAGWESTLANPRLLEAANNFAKAIITIPQDDEEKKILVANSQNQIALLTKALVTLRIDLFIESPTYEEAEGIEEDFYKIKNAIDLFQEKSGVTLAGLEEAIAVDYEDMISLASYNLLLNKNTDFDHYTTERENDEYVETIRICLVVLAFAKGIIKKEVNIVKFNITMISLYESIFNSGFWKEEFTPSGGRWNHIPYSSFLIRDRNIVDELRKENSIIAAKQKQTIIAEQNEIRRVEEEKIQKRNEEYWAANASEKIRLETEKIELNANLENIRKEKQSVALPLLLELQALEGQQLTMILEKNKLGLFKGKEKQLLQSKIDEINTDLTNKSAILENIQEGFDSKINALSERIKQIETELTQNR